MSSSCVLRLVLTAAAAAVVSGLPAWGNQVFSSRSSWENGLTFSLQDFEAQATGALGASYTLGDLGFTSLNSGFLMLVGPSVSVWYDWGSGKSIQADGSPLQPRGVRISLPAGVTAFGLDLMGYGAVGAVTIALSTGQTYSTNTASYPNRVFWGIVATQVFSFVDISMSASGASPLVDNIAWGSASQGQPEPPAGETPEVGTLLMIATGLIALRYARRFCLATPA